MECTVLVFIDLRGVPHRVGRLWWRSRRGQESASFEYDKTWVAHPERFALEPALTLGPGPHHTRLGKALFGAIGDSAPDRWGRVLTRRAESARAAEAGSTPRTLRNPDTSFDRG
jgi:serine/threonine-protein kinase HipA